MSEIDRVLERIRQGTAARMAALQQDRATRTVGVTRATATHAPGARVFDPVSGEEGEVLDGRSENIVVPTARR